MPRVYEKVLSGFYVEGLSERSTATAPMRAMYEIMTKTISSSEAKTRFGSVVDWALTHNDDVIVESHGKLRVVIMPFAEYQKVLDLREKARRREALAQLESLRERVQSRNRDLDEERAEAPVDRFVRDMIEDMVGEKKITFRD